MTSRKSNRDPRRKLPETVLSAQKVQAEIEALAKKLEVAIFAINEKDVKVSQLESELKVLIQKNLELAAALDKAKNVMPAMKFEELARQLRGELETLNSEPQQKLPVGTSRVMVEQVEVEIKGGIDFKDGINLTQLRPQEITSENISTIRFALRPATSITIVEETEDTKKDR